MSEANIMCSIMLRLSKLFGRYFRNNVAGAWVGSVTRIVAPTTVRLSPGDVVLRNARPLHAGLCPGSSDLIGWTPIEITEAWLGRRVAVFTAVEVKDDTKPTQEQINFIEAVQEAGGIAGVAHSPDEAAKIVTDYLGRRT